MKEERRQFFSCAMFYDSRMIERVHSGVYELCDVIGPDEYHERVNNNSYTNRLAGFVLTEAVRILSQSREDEKTRRGIGRGRL